MRTAVSSSSAVTSIGRTAVWRLQLRGSRPCSKGPSKASNEDTGGSSVDWDKAWSSFKQNIGAQFPEVESRVSTEAPRFAQRRDWNAGQRQEDIKRQEQYLLNYWSQDTFFKGGGVAVFALFILLILLAGPPPSDGRCTLPWC